jgi:hypothetical protein
MKKLQLIILFFASCGILSAQSVENIMDLTTPQVHGTARFVGLGGAFSALGNDLSAIHANPAGIGVFRRNHFGLSLGIDVHNTNATYGQTNFDIGSELLFENVGFVRRFSPSTNSKNSYAIGMTYTKKADFYQTLSTENVNRGGDILADYWLASASGYTDDELLDRGLFEEYAAFQTYILDYADTSSNLIGRGNYTKDGTINQENQITKFGRTNEFALTVGGNYSERFQWGVSLNVPTTNITTQNTFTESGFDASSDLSTHSIYREEFFSATGLNVNLGVIIKATQWLRLAASYQTPTAYRFANNYSVTSNSAFNNGDAYDWEVVSDNVGSMTLPGVFRAGFATIFGKYGLISLDYETSGPQNTRFAGNDYDFDEQNVSSLLQRVNTLRGGLELRAQQYFVRAGFMTSSNPLNGNSGYYQHNSAYTTGVGVRNKYYAFDIGFVHSVLNRNEPTYPTDRTQLEALTRKNNLVLSFSAMF